MTLLKLAIKNLSRKRVRSIALVLAAGLACGLVFSAATILGPARSSLELGIQRLGADIMVAPAGYEAKAQQTLLSGEPVAFYMDSKNIDFIKNVPGVQKVSAQLFMASTVLECCYAPDILLVGYEPDSDFTIRPWKRFSYPRTEANRNVDPVTLGGGIGYLSNDDMRFYGKQFRIESVLQSTELGFIDKTIFMDMDTARKMIEVSKLKSGRPLNIGADQISSIFVKVDHGYNVRNVAAEIEKAAPGVIAIRTTELVISERKKIEIALWGVIAAGIAFWAMMLIMLALVFAITVNERGRELGILRAMGATRMHVFRLIVTEAMLLTAFGATVGISLAWVSIIHFKDLIIASLGNIYFLWPSSSYIAKIGLMCLLLMLLSGAVSALYPAFKSICREPYDAIHQEM